jgi:hypothetical protein
VSYRFERGDVETRHKGGIVFARTYVAGAPEFRDRKPTINGLKTAWKEYGPGAGFIYLVTHQRYELRPPRVTSNSFADTLLQQAGDRATLSDFFAAYVKVRELFEIAVKPIRTFRPCR